MEYSKSSLLKLVKDFRFYEINFPLSFLLACTNTGGGHGTDWEPDESPGVSSTFNYDIESGAS